MATNPIPASELPVQPVQATISPMGRVIGMFFSPKATFEDIVRKPSWVLPVLISTILGVISTVALNQRVNWREYVLQQIEKSPRAAQLSTDQKEHQADLSAKITTNAIYAVGVIGSILFALVVGAVMMLAYNLFAGARATFAQSFGIAAHTLALGLISTPIFLLVLYLRPPGTLDPDNPVATNLAAFLPEDSAKWLVSLGKSLDLFTIWTLILLAIGFAAVNPKKLKGATPYVIAFSVWGTMVLVKALWSFILS